MLETAQEHVWLDARRHGVVLARPLLRAAIVAVLGAIGMLGGWPVSAAGVALLAIAALMAVGAVWRWDRTRVVLTSEKLFVVHGVLKRHAAAVRLAKVGSVEVEQSVTGRLLGYGTIVAGDLEIPCVAGPREVYGLVERLLAS
jgi:uncharacterized membrane protein YdbT with pleckstrin-like domain